jgi:hypothetical protein
MTSKPRYILAILSAFVISFSVMSCASQNSSEPSEPTAASILSQDSTDNPDPCHVRAEWLADTLNLTDEQVATIEAARDSLRAIAEAEIAAANGDRALIKAAIKQYRESMKAVIQATLTAEQLALLDSLRAPFHEGRGTRGHHFGQHKHAYRDSVMLVELTAELSLTPEQVAQVQALAESIKANQPANGKQVFYDGMKQILTAEQLALFDAWIAAHPPKGEKGHGKGGKRGRGKGRG